MAVGVVTAEKLFHLVLVKIQSAGVGIGVLVILVKLTGITTRFWFVSVL